MLEILKALLFGIVEGITEWLPISSTGHMILLDEFVELDVSDDFLEMFLVVIQLGAILAVLILFWEDIFPFDFSDKEGKKGAVVKQETMRLWGLVIVACVPAAVVGILFDDILNELFYNPETVAAALIVFGIAFIVIENKNKNKTPRVKELSELTWKDTLIIGVFQLIAAVFPGTSRSGATIIGGLLIGISRQCAARFTFILAIPVMFGASLLKLLKYGEIPDFEEMIILITGMASAFIVSLLVIDALMKFIRTHSFKVFGIYRIVLGLAVMLYFGLS